MIFPIISTASLSREIFFYSYHDFFIPIIANSASEIGEPQGFRVPNFLPIKKPTEVLTGE